MWCLRTQLTIFSMYCVYHIRLRLDLYVSSRQRTLALPLGHASPSVWVKERLNWVYGFLLHYYYYIFIIALLLLISLVSLFSSPSEDRVVRPDLPARLPTSCSLVVYIHALPCRKYAYEMRMCALQHNAAAGKTWRRVQMYIFPSSRYTGYSLSESLRVWDGCKCTTDLVAPSSYDGN